jgi:beta-xylosidase
MCGCATVPVAPAARSGNPILQGWYADPEAHVFDGQYWIYPTYSAPYDQQTFLDAFSSRDLVTWTKHPHALDTANVAWARRAVWAPSIVQKDGWYYLFFGANDIQSDREVGGIGVARSRTPAGPFTDYLGKPLVGAFHNGAQPIDPFVFRDDDGRIYLFYGGWGHCNVVRLSSDLRHVERFPDGTTYKEITPPGYVEGSFMIKRHGIYYLMWSEGDWTGPNYRVAYAMGKSATGPFTPKGVILSQDFHIARGAGHHSVVNVPGTDDWYIVYHRRPLGDDDGDHRQLAIDRMTFNADGAIAPVVMTNTGVTVPRPIEEHP